MPALASHFLAMSDRLVPLAASPFMEIRSSVVSFADTASSVLVTVSFCLPDLISGTIDGAMTEFSTALPMHQANQAHIIAIAAAHRSKLAPDIPTFDESGVKGFIAQSYIGVVAPAKTPTETVDKLQQAIAAGLSPGTPAAERLISLGSEVASAEQMTSKGFADFIRADYASMREAAKLAGITPQ